MHRSHSWVAFSCFALVLGCSRAENRAAQDAVAPSGHAATSSYEAASMAKDDEAAQTEPLAAEELTAPKAAPVAVAPAAPTPAVAPAAVAAAPMKSRAVMSEKKAGPAQGARLAPQQPQAAAPSTENYSHIVDNAFVSPRSTPLSTFSVDVDTASYSNVRRFLNAGQLPPADSVRVEELVNYFTYDYPEPKNDVPFSVTTELSQAPWNPEHELLLIGLQGKRIAAQALPPRNLVFLIDVSGSMSDANKLPLLKYALGELVETLSAKDKVSMVVYAGSSGIVLEPTAGDRKADILAALERLQAGGSTNGAGGITAAYDLAARAFDKRGINRVILATDGDFNVGVASEGELVRLIERRRETGVSLTVLGFGMGNYKDGNLEKLADHGNGNYAYIDNRAEARKVLVEQGGSTLVTIAKDVKIQIEFNPERVGSYRLIGYENRALAARDFNDDRKDAGDIGAGHSVTALYEIIPPAANHARPEVDPLKYQDARRTQAADGRELATVKLRFKRPSAASSELVPFTVEDEPVALARTSNDYRFAVAVAGFGMLLRKSAHRGTTSYPMLQQLATAARGSDPNGYRSGLLSLLTQAARLDAPSSVAVATD